MIYAVIVNDLGLVGGCGLIAIYLLIAERGFKTATLATRLVLEAARRPGLTAVMALQVFVIVGGVTRVIPLTGVTLPFVSYGGSSIVANFVLLALLLLISNRARRGAGVVNAPIFRLFALVRRPVRRADRRSARAGPCSAPRGCARTRTTAASCSRSSGSSAASSAPTTTRCWPAAPPLLGKRYARRYPTGELFALPVGFDDAASGAPGWRSYYNDALDRPQGRSSAGIIDSLVEQDPRRRRAAHVARPQGPAGRLRRARDRKGAVVALDVKTGAVRVLAGHAVLRPEATRARATRLQPRHAGPLPAGIDDQDRDGHGGDRLRPATSPTRSVSGKNGKVISGTPLNNFGGEDFGDITLTDALTHSVNTVWAEVGVKLGRKRDAGVHGALRVRRGPADGLPGRADGAERPVPQAASDHR